MVISLIVEISLTSVCHLSVYTCTLQWRLFPHTAPEYDLEEHSSSENTMKEKIAVKNFTMKK